MLDVLILYVFTVTVVLAYVVRTSAGRPPRYR